MVGIDFSKYTLDYAESQSNGDIHYLQADYLTDELRDSGLNLVKIAGDLTGKPFIENGDLMGIIATPY